MPLYTVDFTRTTHVSQLTVGHLICSATLRRIKLFRLILGCHGAPADNIFQWVLGRITAAGTAGAAVTPTPLNPGDLACTATAGQAHTAEPTYTAGQTLKTIDLHQRATFHLELAPGRELVAPATQNAGFGIKTPVNTALLVNANVDFEE